MKEIFLVTQNLPAAGQLVIGGSAARHISRVLRHTAGDRVMVTDGHGTELTVELSAVSATRVEGKVLGQRLRPREPRHSVVLAQALLKGDKLAEVVETVTELGVVEVIPFVSRRTVAQLSSGRLKRLYHVAASGLETAMRTVLPRISDCVVFNGLLERISAAGQALVAYEGETRQGIDDVLDADADSVLLVVGPEGGFSDDEVDRMKQAGAETFSLGPRRLRAETAAAVAVALCLQRFGDLG